MPAQLRSYSRSTSIRTGRSRCGCLVVGASLLCAALAFTIVVTSGQALAAAGAPDPDLPLSDRVLLAIYLTARRPALDAPAGDPEAVASLDVEPGDDAGTVARELASLGIIDDPGLFLRYLRYRGLDTQIEAGRYEVAGTMSLRALADLLQEATASRYAITIPEGWRREQVAQALGNLGLSFSGGDFLAATRHAPPPDAEAPADTTSTEGFLFPDTYVFDPRMNAEEALVLLVGNFNRRVDSELRAVLRDRGLTVFEAVTLASIVEREAIIASERPLIAAVFLNRMRLGIPLQADPTVQYALGWQADGEWWKPALTASDLQIDSPYNTYLHTGLPPGPIASPGLASLRAIADAPETPFLFFRAACDGSGSHQFAATFEEHVGNACP